ncbi:hypothetical protein CRG98_004140 [Punica granatum]|uniref:EF-hand domain-containing protein n=1 Tax=Punica granatum TaxID=22663 RepID=A0A2I0L4A9_PUNGR|nr:hypothetical protein CRG98_004140 [Punica granatum]
MLHTETTFSDFLSNFRFVLEWALNALSAQWTYWKLLKNNCQKHSSFPELVISREEVDMVMERLGIASNEISTLFEAEPATIEEVKGAFEVFDVDKAGVIGAGDLQRVLCALGLIEEDEEEEEEVRLLVKLNKNQATVDIPRHCQAAHLILAALALEEVVARRGGGEGVQGLLMMPFWGQGWSQLDQSDYQI